MNNQFPRSLVLGVFGGIIFSFIVVVLAYSNKIIFFSWNLPNERTTLTQQTKNIGQLSHDELKNELDSLSSDKNNHNAISSTRSNNPHDKSTPKNRTLTSKQAQLNPRLTKQLEKLDQEQLKQVENMIERMTGKSPSDIFDEEKTDHLWAENEQSKLEVGYYSQSPLRDIGQLQSITCKTKHCLVKVEVPNNIDLHPSYYQGWSNPVMVNLISNAEFSDTRIIAIYTRREE